MSKSKLASVLPVINIFIMPTYLIAIAALGLIVLIVIGLYNKMTRMRILTQEAWSGIGATLQQRLDLIPNLVEVVKGYAGHENKTLTDVIKVRNESISALTPEAQIEAAKHMQAALMNVRALSEQYPDLKANMNFVRLQEELAAIEEKLNQSRRYYNGTVRNYNQSISVFPHNMVASVFGFKASPFFLEDAAAQTAPKVSF